MMPSATTQAQRWLTLIGMGDDGSNGFGGEISPQATQAIQSGGGGLY